MLLNRSLSCCIGSSIATSIATKRLAVNLSNLIKDCFALFKSAIFANRNLIKFVGLNSASIYIL